MKNKRFKKTLIKLDENSNEIAGSLAVSEYGDSVIMGINQKDGMYLIQSVPGNITVHKIDDNGNIVEDKNIEKKFVDGIKANLKEIANTSIKDIEEIEATGDVANFGIITTGLKTVGKALLKGTKAAAKAAPKVAATPIGKAAQLGGGIGIVSAAAAHGVENVGDSVKEAANSLSEGAQTLSTTKLSGKDGKWGVTFLGALGAIGGAFLAKWIWDAYNEHQDRKMEIEERRAEREERRLDREERRLEREERRKKEEEYQGKEF